MRAIGSSAAAVLASGLVPMAMLIEMDLTSPLNLATAPIDIVIGGTTYYGTKGLGRVGPVQDTPAELRGLSFELSGVPSDLLAVALAEPVQGKAVRLKLTVLSPSTYAVLDTRLVWSGYLDVMSIEDSEQGATIGVSAEHGCIDLVRPLSSLYTDAEQQRLASGDLFFQFVADQVEQRVTWPSKELLRK